MRIFLVPLLLFLLVVVAVCSSPSCTPVSYQPPIEGSHGYRTWYSTQFLSIMHDGAPLCIPEDWRPVGAVYEDDSSALFAPDSTAVFIHGESFILKEITFTHSSYVVTLLMPRDTDVALQTTYEEMVRHTFERVGALFNDDSTQPPRTHTVLVTAGLGYIDTEEGSVYPDPGPRVSYLILPPSDSRSEELFIHAIAHLYNRFQDGGLEYQNAQAPISPSDWQELEASWMETALHSSDTQRRARFEYLYRTHQTQTEIQGITTHSGMSHDDLQYAHYVLAPLVMIGIEGMLPSDTSVDALLRYVHAHPEENFVDILRATFSHSELSDVQSWMNGNKKIPREILLAGLARYK